MPFLSVYLIFETMKRPYHLNISGLWPVSPPRHTGHGQRPARAPKFLRRYEIRGENYYTIVVGDF